MAANVPGQPIVRPAAAAAIANIVQQAVPVVYVRRLK